MARAAAALVAARAAARVAVRAAAAWVAGAKEAAGAVEPADR